jgi:hypothetical protein
LKRPDPFAERRYKVREAFLAVEKQVAAPDALCLADHPAPWDWLAALTIETPASRVFNSLLGPIGRGCGSGAISGAMA